MRLIFFIAFFLKVLSANSQIVYGININTTKANYVNLLKKKGIISPKKFANHYLFDNVRFADIEGCKFEIGFNQETDSITYVNIIFPHRSYDGDVSLMATLSSQLEAKYGLGKEDEYYKSFSNSRKGGTCYEWKDPNISLQQGWDKNIPDNWEENKVILWYTTKAKRGPKPVSSDL